MGLSHLDDMVLNEYLDGALPAGAAEGVEAHLAICPLCTVRLAEMQQLFAALASLPDEKVSRDLAPQVLDRLAGRPRRSSAHRFSPGWVALPGLQALSGAACLAWLWFRLGLTISVPSWQLTWPDMQQFAVGWPPVLPALVGSFDFLHSLQIDWLAARQALEQLYLFSNGFFSQFPAIDLPEAWLVLFIPLGVALWVASNMLLLKAGSQLNHGGNNE